MARVLMFCRYSSVFFLFFVILVEIGSAQSSLTGGRGTLRVQSAQTIPKGSILLSSFFQTYFKDDAGKLRHDHTWNLGLSYGWTDFLELSAHLRPYQDDQRHSYPPPGHSEFALKWQTPLSNTRVQTGLQATLRLPTTKYHNVLYEPYSSDKIAWAMQGLMSFAVPGNVPLKFSLNLGYMDHNIGTFLKKESTDQILFGMGFKVAAKAIIFYTEYSGEIFINQPGLDFRNNSMRLTHGFRLRAPLNLMFDIGADVGLSRTPDTGFRFVHEYAKWRLFSGLSYNVKPKRYLLGVNTLKRRDSIRHEKLLRELRSRRENVDRDLDEMLEELENDSQKDEN